jgi:hypothetical protein
MADNHATADNQRSPCCSAVCRLLPPHGSYYRNTRLCNQEGYDDDRSAHNKPKAECAKAPPAMALEVASADAKIKIIYHAQSSISAGLSS